jgi:hypothetical protein
MCVTPFVLMVASSSKSDPSPLIPSSLVDFCHSLHWSIWLIVVVIAYIASLPWMLLIFVLLKVSGYLITNFYMKLWLKVPLRFRWRCKHLEQITGGIASIYSFFILCLFFSLFYSLTDGTELVESFINCLVISTIGGCGLRAYCNYRWEEVDSGKDSQLRQNIKELLIERMFAYEDPNIENFLRRGSNLPWRDLADLDLKKQKEIMGNVSPAFPESDKQICADIIEVFANEKYPGIPWYYLSLKEQGGVLNNIEFNTIETHWPTDWNDSTLQDQITELNKVQKNKVSRILEAIALIAFILLLWGGMEPWWA